MNTGQNMFFLSLMELFAIRITTLSLLVIQMAMKPPSLGLHSQQNDVHQS